MADAAAGEAYDPLETEAATAVLIMVLLASMFIAEEVVWGGSVLWVVYTVPAGGLSISPGH